MIERICSTENELSIQVFPPITAKRELLTNALMNGLKLTCPIIYADVPENGNRVFFRNGFCAYVDRPIHSVELALPECSSVYDAVACDRAGMYMIEDAALAAKKLLSNIIRSEKFLVYRNNVARPTAIDKEPEVAYGTHENYSVHEQELREAIRKNEKQMQEVTRFFKKSYDHTDPEIYASMLLLPFLVTRQVLCGAGSLLPYSGRYEISQRSRFFVGDIGSNSVNERSICHIKKENHASGHHRLHLICGDANMCSYSTYLKLGTTKIIIRMIEENALDPFLLYIPDVINVLHGISFDSSLKKTYKVVTEKNMIRASAIDMQQLFHDNAANFIERNGGDEESKLTLERWQHTLDCLKNSPEKLCGKIDWITKKMLIDKIMENAGVSLGSKKILDTNLMYHALNTSKGLFYKIEKPSWKVFNEEDINNRTIMPPPTRALARLKTVDAINANISSMTWDEILCVNKDEQTTYRLPDPFDAEIHPRLR